MKIYLSENISIRLVAVKEYDLLHSLMWKIYPPAYQYLWNDDCTWYINFIYNRDSVEKDLSVANSHFYFVFDRDVEVGILKIQHDISYPDMPDVKATRVHRIYLSEEAQGKGISNRLMAYVEEVARQNESKLIWLGCMDSKHQALRYYEKHGFMKGSISYLDYELLIDSYRGIYLMHKEL